MTDLTDVNIKELLKLDNDDLRAALEEMLPKPTYPEHLLGVWAKHPERGDVVCIWDKPDSVGDVKVHRRDERSTVGAYEEYVPVSDLTFPHQATKPEDVEPGEAWLVDVKDRHRSYTRVVATKDEPRYWRTAEAQTPDEISWADGEVTLIAPLVPARPEPEPEHVVSYEEYAAL